MKQVDEIRAFVNKHYIEPARNKGRTHVSVNSGDVQTEMEKKGLLPPNRYPNICNALQGNKIQDDYRVELCGGKQPDGVITVRFEIR